MRRKERRGEREKNRWRHPGFWLQRDSPPGSNQLVLLGNYPLCMSLLCLVCVCVWWGNRMSGEGWTSHSLNQQSFSYPLTLFQLARRNSFGWSAGRNHLNPLNNVCFFFAYLQPVCSSTSPYSSRLTSQHKWAVGQIWFILEEDISLPSFLIVCINFFSSPSADNDFIQSSWTWPQKTDSSVSKRGKRSHFSRDMFLVFIISLIERWYGAEPERGEGHTACDYISLSVIHKIFHPRNFLLNHLLNLSLSLSLFLSRSLLSHYLKCLLAPFPN